MRFLVDAQLPPALARWLSGQGHEAVHVFDLNLAGADDRLIWERAARTGAVILTKDEDFALRRTLAESGPATLWLRLGNTRKTALLNWLGPLLPEVLVALERGETLLEVA